MQKYYEELKDYYTLMSNEDERFSRDKAHTIEYLTTMRYLEKHLPKRCKVLDCSAASGAYSFLLAKIGYEVTAGDLVERHIDELRKKNKNGLLKDIYLGSVLDLSKFEDEKFDDVICMGALYHLHEKKEREKCILECLRVLKKNGIFIFAYINRNAVYIDCCFNHMLETKEREKLLDDGRNGVFYTMDFGEPQELVKKYDIEEIEDVGVDGLMYPMRDILNNFTDEEFKSYMDYHFNKACKKSPILYGWRDELRMKSTKKAKTFA